MHNRSKHCIRRRAVIALGLAFALALGLCGWMLMPQREPPKTPEPVYKGGTLSQWCQSYRFRESILRLFQPMTDADLERLRSYGRTDGQIAQLKKNEVVWAANRTAKRDEAAAAIRAMGTNAVPALMDMLRFEDTPGTRVLDFLRYRTPLCDCISGEQKDRYLPAPGQADAKHNNAFVGLEVLGPVAAPALKQALTDPNPRVRQAATNLLAKLK